MRTARLSTHPVSLNNSNDITFSTDSPHLLNLQQNTTDALEQNGRTTYGWLTSRSPNACDVHLPRAWETRNLCNLAQCCDNATSVVIGLDRLGNVIGANHDIRPQDHTISQHRPSRTLPNLCRTQGHRAHAQATANDTTSRPVNPRYSKRRHAFASPPRVT
jgi:hypothetical protein